MNTASFEVHPIGYVESPLVDVAVAPRQGDEGAPVARIRLRDEVAPGVSPRTAARDISLGDELIVLTWLHLADRSVVEVRPRDELSRPLTGVFSTRSADRPNPVGLHRVRVVGVGDGVIEVEGLEAVDGTPVIDIKPVIGGVEER